MGQDPYPRRRFFQGHHGVAAALACERHGEPQPRGHHDGGGVDLRTIMTTPGGHTTLQWGVAVCVTL